MTTTLDVSVVICAYTEERWYDLTLSIESIQKQTFQPCEIIVVIDHNPQMFERARESFTEAIVIENKEAKGLSGARNSGIALAKGSLIAFLDDDAEAEPDWLERLVSLCQDQQVLGAGGVVEPLWIGPYPRWFPREFYWVIGCTYQNIPQKVIKVRNPYGGCMCIRKDVFEVVGGFRNGIGRIGSNPMGGEETELCIRAGQYWAQRCFLCDPQAKIHHHIPQARTTWHYFVKRCYAEGKSKATITSFVGIKGSLASERAYTMFILPKGIINDLIHGIVKHDISSILQSASIISGLAITMFGYVIGSIEALKLRNNANTRLRKLLAHE